jgi:hypothetical protein
MIANPKAAGLHSWSVGAWLALLSLILWVTAFAWYFYGHQRVANHVATFLWRVGLRKTEPAHEKKTKRVRR